MKRFCKIVASDALIAHKNVTDISIYNSGNLFYLNVRLFRSICEPRHTAEFSFTKKIQGTVKAVPCFLKIFNYSVLYNCLSLSFFLFLTTRNITAPIKIKMLIICDVESPNKNPLYVSPLKNSSENLITE